jgi:uncharacterized protein YqeY
MNINTDITAAMKSGDKDRLNTLRSLKNALTNEALSKGNIDTELSKDQFLRVVQKQINQRKDSITAFEKGGRGELAKQEQIEIDILSAYLPKQLSDDELEALVTQAMNQVQATSKRQMGEVIKIVNSAAAGAADPKTVAAKVSARLQ